MKNKYGFLEISFGWLFALIVGAFIIFLAVFFVVKFGEIERVSSDVQLSKSFGILLNPLESGFESGRLSLVELPAETRINSECYEAGNFGSQTLRTSQESFGDFTDSYIDVEFQNKYIFSDNPLEGRNFYLFSKPFEFPFKVADLVYITSSEKEFCFVNAPKEIDEEINDLRQPNLFNFTQVNDCPDKSEKICFGTQEECDTIVRIETKTINKNNQIINFEGNALMYAAIFSSPEMYECQVKRLMKRVSILANLYLEKSSVVSVKNCNTNLNLLSLESSAKSFSSSSDLKQINLIVEDIKKKNDIAYCKLW